MTRWGLQTTTTVVDNFNRANETPLASPWSVWFGPGMNLVSGQVEPADEWAGSARLGDVFADGDVFVTVTEFVLQAAATDLYLRMLPDFAGGYALGIDSSLVILWRADLIGSPILAEVDHIPTVGNRYKLRAAGNHITAYIDTGSGWEQVIEVMDDAYPEPGFVAFDAFGSGIKLDDFGGGSLAASRWPSSTDDRWDLTLA